MYKQYYQISQPRQVIFSFMTVKVCSYRGYCFFLKLYIYMTDIILQLTAYMFEQAYYHNTAYFLHLYRTDNVQANL